MTRARRTPALCAAALLALGACSGGGDDGAAPPAAPAAGTPAPGTAPTDDVARITELARSVIMAQTAGDLCRERFSAKFVKTVFKSVARCEKGWQADDPKDRTQDATVSNVRISGSAATATVGEVGGEWAGAQGTWAFLKVGDTWRVAAWGVDYLRAGANASFSPSKRSTDPGDLLGDLEVLACLRKELAEKEDKAFTRLTYGLLRDDATARAALNSLMFSCAAVPGSDGLTPMRRSFEVGVRQGAVRGGMPQIADCTVRRLRAAMSQEDLHWALDSFLTKGTYPKPLQRRVNNVMLDCALAKV